LSSVVPTAPDNKLPPLTADCGIKYRGNGRQAWSTRRRKQGRRKTGRGEGREGRIMGGGRGRGRETESGSEERSYIIILLIYKLYMYVWGLN